MGTLLYGPATVAELFVSGQLRGLLEQRRTQTMIDSHTDHFVVAAWREPRWCEWPLTSAVSS
jgi:hypothetical protein